MHNLLAKLGQPNYIRGNQLNDLVHGAYIVMVKNNSLSASLEDYLEAIFNLAGESKVARSKDIAQMLGVSRASVTGALRTLKERDLANYKPYGYITLTDDGKTVAKEVIQKHNIISSFFINVLGVDHEIAQKAACKAEHTLGPEVIKRLLYFIEFVTIYSKNNYDVNAEFKKFYRKKNTFIND